MKKSVKELQYNTNDYKKLLKNVDSIYINTEVKKHYDIIYKALNQNKHIMCEAPICDDEEIAIAKVNNIFN